MIKKNIDNLNQNTSDELKDYINEFEEKLLDFIIENKNYNDLSDIKPIDIVKMKENMDEFFKDYKTRRIKKFNNKYLLIGISEIIIGILLLIYSYEKFIIYEYDSIVMLITIIALCIIIICVTKIYYKNLTKINEKKYYKNTLVNKWTEIENELDRISDKLNVDNSYIPIGIIIKVLVKSDILSNEDNKNIKQILLFRNNLVHSKENIISIKLLRENIKIANQILYKLKNVN